MRITLVCLLAVAVPGVAIASENYDLRYAPGIGGADMSAPYESGWVVQTPIYRYRGSIQHDSRQQIDLQALGAPAGSVANVTTGSKIRIGAEGVLARLSYMSNTQVLGAQLGFTALLPLLRKKTDVTIERADSQITPASLEALGPVVRAAALQSARGIARTNSNSSTGIGDLELAPMLRWSTDNSQWMFVPAIVLPTGSYDRDKAANPGSGKFYTFRPLVQYSYIGDGWDVGARGSLAINSRNKDTHFRTGNYVNVDLALMKTVTESWRLGMAGYAVVQTTEDSRSETPQDPAVLARQGLTLGAKGHVYGLGVQFAYLQGGGDYLVDGRLLQEFGAKDRPEGTTFVLNLTKPF
ncbi:SphA family protein [Chitinimonas naiadis]